MFGIFPAFSTKHVRRCIILYLVRLGFKLDPHNRDVMLKTGRIAGTLNVVDLRQSAAEL